MNWHTIIDLLEAMSLMAMIGYIMIRFQHSEYWRRNMSIGFKKAAEIVMFSLLSLYAGFMAIPFLDGYVSLRHVGAICAGLIYGPVVGVIVGLVAAAQRVNMGGNTVLASAIAVILAGIIAGLWHKYRPVSGRIGTLEAAILTLLVEGVWIVLAMSLGDDKRLALQMVTASALPMIAGNVFGVGCLITLVNTINDEYETKAAKQEKNKELIVAAAIQNSFLPEINENWPRDWELAILSKPALEVSGDFHDCFALDEDKWCVVIGDVSGKGVPAALFMAVTMAYIQLLAQAKNDPAMILYALNNELCRRNKENMFATLALLLVNTKNGAISYSLAGHNSLYQICANNVICELNSGRTLAVGAVPDIEHKTAVCQLELDETILLYTDGISEAMNKTGDIYGEQRLRQVLGRGFYDAEEIKQAIIDDIDLFTKHAEQSDDMTLLVLKRK